MKKYHFIAVYEKDWGGHGMTRLVWLRLEERIQNYHPVQVPSLNTPDYFRMNFDNSWMVSYGSQLRKKEENFDDVRFESSKPTVEKHEYGSQDSNNVETKGKPSGVHRETVASTKRENPRPPRKQQRQQQQQPFYQRIRERSPFIQRKTSFERAELGTLRWYSHLQVRMVRHLDVYEKEVYTHSLDKKRREKCIWTCHTSSIEEKIPKIIGEEFKYEDWLHCLYRRRFKTRFEICKDEDGELGDSCAIRRLSDEIVLPSRPMNYVMFHHKRRWHTQKRGCHTKKEWHTKGVHTL